MLHNSFVIIDVEMLEWLVSMMIVHARIYLLVSNVISHEYTCGYVSSH